MVMLSACWGLKSAMTCCAGGCTGAKGFRGAVGSGAVRAVQRKARRQVQQGRAGGQHRDGRRGVVAWNIWSPVLAGGHTLPRLPMFTIR